MQDKKFIYLAIVSITIFAVLSRFLPHLPNLSAISALGIFSAGFLSWKKSLTLTLGARLLSDVVLGFFSWPLMLAVYGCHAFSVFLGSRLVKKKLGVSGVVFAGTVSALVFFLVTNFAFLYTFYPHSLGGILASYSNALPFLRGTVVGDVGYSLLFYYSYVLAMKLSTSGEKQLTKNVA